MESLKILKASPYFLVIGLVLSFMLLIYVDNSSKQMKLNKLKSFCQGDLVAPDIGISYERVMYCDGVMFTCKEYNVTLIGTDIKCKYITTLVK